MDFYERVKHLVKERQNTTLKIFVESLGINYDSYNSSRRYGNLPRVDEAIKIADALHTTAEYLVCGTEPETSRKYIDRIEAIKAVVNKPL